MTQNKIDEAYTIVVTSDESKKGSIFTEPLAPPQGIESLGTTGELRINPNVHRDRPNLYSLECNLQAIELLLVLKEKLLVFS